MTLVQLGEMASEKFGRTDAMEDIDEAINRFRTGLPMLPRGYENRYHIEALIGQAYSNRYRKSNRLTDAQSAVEHTNMALNSIPKSNPTQAIYLEQFLGSVRDLVNATTSISEIGRAIKLGQAKLHEIQALGAERHKCLCLFADILARKYFLTRNIEDLIELVRLAQKCCNEYNDRKKTKSDGLFKVSLFYELHDNITRLSRIADGAAKEAATRKLHELVPPDRKCKHAINLVVDY